MKTKMNLKDIIYKISFALTILIVIPFTGLSQSEISETIVRTFDVTDQTRIEFQNKVGDVEVRGWDKNEVKLETFVKLKSSDHEDLEKTLAAIKNADIDQSGYSLIINTKFYKEWNSWNIVRREQHRITLTDGSKVRLSKVSVSYKLTVPESNDLILAIKYCDINLDDLEGDIKIDLYSGDLIAGALPHLGELRLRYANAVIVSTGKIKMDIYDSDIEVGTTGDLLLESKYSEIIASEVASVKIKSYDDDIRFDKLESIQLEAKYTDFETGDFESGKLDIYDCKMQAGKVGDLYLMSKYTEFNFLSVRNLDWPQSYDDKINIEFLGNCEIVSKYTEFTIGSLANKFILSSHDDNVTIGKVENGFDRIEVNGKYTDVRLTFNNDVKYIINTDLKYTRFEYPEESYKELRFHKENSKFIYKAVTHNTEEGNVLPELNFVLYDGSVIIRH